MENTKYNTVETVPKFNRNIVENNNIYTSKTDVEDNTKLKNLCLILLSLFRQYNMLKLNSDT